MENSPTMSACNRATTISIIGSGMIGRSWAMVFLSGGFRVKMYDSLPGQAHRAVEDVRKQLYELEQKQTLRGSISAAQQVSMLSSHEGLHDTLENAFFVQECVCEELQTKRSVFQELESCVTDAVILSSSTSCLLPSHVFGQVKKRTRCLVSHPVNPLYHVRLVELVPHPDTLPAVMDSTHALMRQVGQVPVRLTKEIDGFALNRIQYAVIAESWRLARDGIMSVKDVDLVMTEGLGMRYAIIGPMETMHLNAPNGMEDYLTRYKEGMIRIMASFGPVPEFAGPEAQRVVQEMCDLIPSDGQHLSARRERRDQLLTQLAGLKQ